MQEIVDFIADHDKSTTEQIINEFCVSSYEVEEKLREAEILGMVVRKMRDGDEIWTV